MSFDGVEFTGGVMLYWLFLLSSQIKFGELLLSMAIFLVVFVQFSFFEKYNLLPIAQNDSFSSVPSNIVVANNFQQVVKFRT